MNTTAAIPTRELTPYNNNPRQGNIHLIAESLQTNGQYRPIVVNKGTHTGTPNEVLVGNHTARALQFLADMNPNDTQWENTTAYLVDVTAEQAARIVLADNKTSDNATYNDEELFTLLQSVDHDLDGTGYEYDDLEALQALYADPEQQGEGEGPPDQDTPQEQDDDHPARTLSLPYTRTHHSDMQNLLDQYHDKDPSTGRKNHLAIVRILEVYTGTTAPEEQHKTT